MGRWSGGAPVLFWFFGLFSLVGSFYTALVLCKYSFRGNVTKFCGLDKCEPVGSKIRASERDVMIGATPLITSEYEKNPSMY